MLASPPRVEKSEVSWPITPAEKTRAVILSVLQAGPGGWGKLQPRHRQGIAIAEDIETARAARPDVVRGDWRAQPAAGGPEALSRDQRAVEAWPVLAQPPGS